MIYNRIKERIERQKAFFSSNRKNETLLLNWSNKYYLSLHWLKYLANQQPEELCNKKDADRINDEFLAIMREHVKDSLKYEDDIIPTPDVFFDIGTVTSAMGGVPSVLTGETIWGKPVLDSWEDMEKLSFNPDNIWLKLHITVYSSLIERWEGDFLPIPYLHHSPLDAAWSLRGDQIFYDFYDYPDEVKALCDWCADWSIKVENHILQNVNEPEGFMRGVWGVALPARAVFVNGDPIDLISGELQYEFDRPYAEKLFTSTGGGFFHHHAIGIRQVKNVSQTKGLLVQNIYTDPNQPTPAEMLIKDEKIREAVLEASLIAPIHLTGDFYPFFDELLPVLREGRFILRYEGGDEEKFVEMLNKLNRVRSNRP